MYEYSQYDDFHVYPRTPAEPDGEGQQDQNEDAE